MGVKIAQCSGTHEQQSNEKKRQTDILHNRVRFLRVRAGACVPACMHVKDCFVCHTWEVEEGREDDAMNVLREE